MAELMRGVWAGLAVVALTSPLLAAPADPVGTAVAAAGRAAAGKKIASVLLVVRAEAGSTGDLDPVGVLADLTVAVRDGLEGQNLNVTVFDGQLPANGRPLTPADVAALPDADAVGAVVSVEYRRKSTQRVVRISVVTETGTLWTKSVSQGTAVTTARNSRAARCSSRASAGNAPVQTVPQAFGSSSVGGQGLAGLSGLSGFNLANGLSGTGTGDDSTEEDLEDGEIPPLNEKVLQFALDHLGEQVGNGECWTLAAEALIAAGARPARGYEFGRKVEMSEIIPGDILQFTSARFESAGGFMVLGAPHHTAIVQAVRDEKVVHILHQNVNGDKTVQSMTLDFSTMVAGEVQAFRPVAEGEEGGGRGEGGGRCRRPGGGGIEIDIDIDIDIDLGDIGSDPEVPDFLPLASSGR